MNHTMIGASSALAILALIGGMPATGLADGHKNTCNVVLDGDGEPVLESDNDEVHHSNTGDCPDDDASAKADDAGSKQQTAAAGTTTEQPAAVVEPLIVYFDVNKDGLDAGARAEVEAYVAQLMATSPKTLSVVGYTDTSGSADLNARLSEARAKNVEAALVDAGVPSALIARGAAGESGLAVATPDGTREANNRRVTITPGY